MRINCAEQTDSDLLEMIKQGHEGAFRCLFDRYYKPLLGAAYNIVRDNETSRDLVQQVLVEFWAARQKEISKNLYRDISGGPFIPAR